MTEQERRSRKMAYMKQTGRKWIGEVTWEGEQRNLDEQLHTAIYFTTVKFPGDKSSGNDKLHCTANSTYPSSSSSLQLSFHLTMCFTSAELKEKVSRRQIQSVCVCVLAFHSWQCSRSCHLVLLPGEEVDRGPKTLKRL